MPAKQALQFEKIISDILLNGYAICDDYLSPVAVLGLREAMEMRYQAGAFKNAGIGKLQEVHQNNLIRKDEINWLAATSENLAEQVFLTNNNAFIAYLNATCYLGISSSEIHFSKYPVGAFYKRHKDAFQQQKGRVLSMVFYLNNNWDIANGGNLVLFPTKNNQTESISITPIAGRFVCFESALLEHEVTICLAERFSITGWLLNQ
jgi:SM-20-related protein